ncbi:hypothetical protein FRC08_006611, partial [Ceratobasidium sp. 394]
MAVFGFWYVIPHAHSLPIMHMFVHPSLHFDLLTHSHRATHMFLGLLSHAHALSPSHTHVPVLANPPLACPTSMAWGKGKR